MGEGWTHGKYSAVNFGVNVGVNFEMNCEINF
jgi:hypothetical protein